MNPLEQFLSKIQTFLSSASASKKTVLEVIKTITSVELQDKDITIKDGTIHIHASPGVRNHIFMQKGAILKGLQEKNVNGVREIR